MSEFIEAASRGERVLICKRNLPIAELRPVESVRTEPRPIGLGREAFSVPDSFFEPLPDEVLGDFYPMEDRTPRSKVAETPREPFKKDKPVEGGRQR